MGARGGRGVGGLGEEEGVRRVFVGVMTSDQGDLRKTEHVK